MKFCRDCRHRVVWRELISEHLKCGRQADWCTTQQDPVTGLEHHTFNLLICDAERASNYAADCGPDARYFMAGDTKATVNFQRNGRNRVVP